MIIDSHAHLKHGDSEGTEYSPETIVRTMDQVGIDKSVVFAMSTTTRRSIEMAAEAAAKFPDRLVPYVYALPHYERAVCDELREALSERGFRGIKIHSGECTLADYIIGPVMEVAAAHGVPCLIDLGGSFGTAESLARGYPETKLIIAHLGRYLSGDWGLIDRFIGLAESCANVYLDVSGVVLLEGIKAAVRRVGSARVLWGTDGPHAAPDTVSFARTELDKIRILGLLPEEESDVLGGAAAKLLGV
jgi:hypothetical protein